MISDDLMKIINYNGFYNDASIYNFVCNKSMGEYNKDFLKDKCEHCLFYIGSGFYALSKPYIHTNE